MFLKDSCRNAHVHFRANSNEELGLPCLPPPDISAQPPHLSLRRTIAVFAGGRHRHGAVDGGRISLGASDRARRAGVFNGMSLVLEYLPFWGWGYSTV